MKTIGSLVLAALASIRPSAMAHELIIIEHSSTSLSVFYDNSSVSGAVIPIAPDTWALDFFSFGITFRVSEQPHVWLEPENEGLANEVLISPGLFDPFVILSDMPATAGALPNGTSVATFGFDLRDNQPISLRFDDRADDRPSPVPDTGTTLGLISLCLVTLAGAAHFRRFRIR